MVLDWPEADALPASGRVQGVQTLVRAAMDRMVPR